MAHEESDFEIHRRVRDALDGVLDALWRTCKGPGKRERYNRLIAQLDRDPYFLVAGIVERWRCPDAYLRVLHDPDVNPVEFAGTKFGLVSFWPQDVPVYETDTPHFHLDAKWSMDCLIRKGWRMVSFDRQAMLETILSLASLGVVEDVDWIVFQQIRDPAMYSGPHCLCRGAEQVLDFGDDAIVSHWSSLGCDAWNQVQRLGISDHEQERLFAEALDDPGTYILVENLPEDDLRA